MPYRQPMHGRLQDNHSTLSILSQAVGARGYLEAIEFSQEMKPRPQVWKKLGWICLPITRLQLNSSYLKLIHGMASLCLSWSMEFQSELLH